jgi:tetratricopeptide (TPR) repeat protein
MSKVQKYVFIIHHFDEKSRKYAALLTWILNQRNISTIYGENVVGKLSENVPRRIESSCLVLAVLTRDVEIGGGKYQPSQWTLQEVTWAVAHDVPCILIVEEDVEFEGGIVGDLEQIRFAPGDFASTLERVVNQVTALLNSVIISQELPENTLNDRVWRLIMEGREEAAKGKFENLLRISKEAWELDRTAWRAALNIGVALVKLGQLPDAKQIFLEILKTFDDNGQAKAMANHNLGWLEQVKSAGDPHNIESLRAEATFYEAALAAMHSKTHTRASLIQCKVLFGEVSEASALLMQSLNYHGFLEALRYESEQRGYLGHQILRQLPESEWLYPLLFPVWHAADDELRENHRLVLN